MRQLVVICESTHAEEVLRNVQTFCHPALEKFVSVIPVDVGASGPFRKETDILLGIVRDDRPGTSEPPLVCYTRPAGTVLKLRELARAFDFEIDQETLARLTKRQSGDRSPVPIQSRLNQCGLSLRGGAVELMQHWSHSSIDRIAVDQWLAQFGTLGAQFKWIGEQILASVEMVAHAELGELFNELDIPLSSALCINRDVRKTAKSGDVISNLLTKRHPGTTIYAAPADAIDQDGVSELAIFEDGLWSGTEALGVIESLLGLRDPSKLKTPALKRPEVFGEVAVVFAYGVATDYGAALVRRFLREKGLSNVQIRAAKTITVASPAVLAQLESGEVDFSKLRETGPSGALNPHIFARLLERGFDPEKLSMARDFCAVVGEQLLTHYLGEQQVLHGWSPWAPEKVARASLGMHGLGLTQAFSHSVPKASLPLLWRGGPVTYNGRTVDWVPLFRNS